MVKSSCREVLIKNSDEIFQENVSFILFSKISLQTFIGVKTKFNGNSLWELRQILIKPKALQSNTLCNEKMFWVECCG